MFNGVQVEEHGNHVKLEKATGFMTQKSETELTAGVLKKDPKTHKRFKIKKN